MGIPSDMKGKLVNALIAYDRRQAKRRGYNPYALGHYLKALEKVDANMALGYTMRTCIMACFNGRLGDHLLKTAGLSLMSVEEHRGGVTCL